MTSIQPAAPENSKSPRRPIRRFVVPCCGGCLLALLALLGFVLLSAPKLYYVPSAAMEPTLHGGDAATADHIISSNWEYRLHPPRHGDIVVFLAPARADAENISQHIPPRELVNVKRVIGLPGETIHIREARQQTGARNSTAYAVFRNGVRLLEPYIQEPMEPPMHSATYGIDKPIKLGPDEYYLLGDNRNDSNDSQYWGPLEKRRILGKVTWIVAPAERTRRFP